MTKIPENEQVALEFPLHTLEKACQEIVKRKCPFEIGPGFFILPKEVAEELKKDPSLECREVKIISLFHLPREEANQIRKRHWPL